MAQEFRRIHHENDGRGSDHGHPSRWPAEAPSAAVARVVLKVDASITLKRTAAAAWLTAHSHAVPALPIKPSPVELAVLIALAETYGASLYRETRFLPVIDFMADYGAVKLVQRVMYGETRATEGAMTWFQSENERLADLLHDARVPFEFLCGTWPEVFMAQAHATLAKIGVQVRPSDADTLSSSNDDGEDRGRDEDDNEEGGGHA